jgi:phosphate starvation-inducible PhoH-like protein
LSNKYEARFELDDFSAAAEIFGEHDHHLTQIEKTLGVRLVTRGQEIVITGNKGKVEQAREVLVQLQKFHLAGNRLTFREVAYAIKAAQSGIKNALVALATDVAMITPGVNRSNLKPLARKNMLNRLRPMILFLPSGRPERERPIWRWLWPSRRFATRMWSAWC